MLSYHTYIEEYFGIKPEPPNKPNCGNYCSLCKDEHMHFTKWSNKNKLISSLTPTVFAITKKKLTPAALKDAVKANKDTIFEKDSVPARNMGPIHALHVAAVGVEGGHSG